MLHRGKISVDRLALAVGFAALLQIAPHSARAEVLISGKPDALTIEMRDASVEDGLAALRAMFNLQYQTSIALNRKVSGTYRGSLTRVVADLLQGQNYIMRSSGNGRRLVVFGASGPGAAMSGPLPRSTTGAIQPDLLAPQSASGAQGWTEIVPPPRPPESPVPAKPATSSPAGNASVTEAVPSAPASAAATSPDPEVVPAPAPHHPPVQFDAQPGGVEGYNG